jgi:D-alanine-D-alanine ligase
MYNNRMSKLFETLPPSLKIGVLRGGPSPEYDLSLLSGQNVLKNLSETHSPTDIFISRDGVWHVNGVERSPDRALRNLDVVWNALHGTYGEDGGVQEILDSHAIKYTGSKRYPSAISMKKHLAKEHAISMGIKTPVYILVRKEDDVTSKAKEIFNGIPHPLAVKPSHGGSAFGFAIVNNYAELLGALDALLQNHDTVIVEEFINGISASCLVTEDFRGQSLYAFPPSQRLLVKETEAVEEYSKKIHDLLDLSHYSQSDFIIAPRRGIYFLELNTLPKLTPKSLAGKAIESVGSSMKEFIHHVIHLSLND